MNNALVIWFEKLQGIFGLIVLGLVILEWVTLVAVRRMESNKEGWINLLCYIIESIPYFLLDRVLIFGVMVWLYEYRLFTLGLEWYVWVLAYLLYDFMFWLVHLLGHKVRFFWCIHGVHHTAREMKLTVAVRGSFLGILHTPHTVIWLPLLGFDPFMIFIVESVARLYGLYEHVNEHFDRFIGKQTRLEKFLVTPSVHRVHHARNNIYLDRNYGETFSIWDRLFGTFQPELTDVKPVYGLTDDKINSKHFLQVQFGLWKDLWKDIVHAPTWHDKLKYLVMPPGWNHIDGGKMAHSFREEALADYALKKELEKPGKPVPAALEVEEV